MTNEQIKEIAQTITDYNYDLYIDICNDNDDDEQPSHEDFVNYGSDEESIRELLTEEYIDLSGINEVCEIVDFHPYIVEIAKCVRELHEAIEFN